MIVSHGKLNTARTLEARLWGTVENGGDGERIFRLNQDGCDALAWLDDLKTDPAEDAALAAELDAFLGML